MDEQPKESAPNSVPGISRPMGTALTASTALIRLIPYIFRIPAALNLAPTVATDVFAGARLRSWHAFAIAVGIHAIVDLILLPIQGMGSSPALYFTFMAFVYPAIIINVFLGRLLSRTESVLKIGGVTVLGSILYYLVTNFGSWVAMSGPELPVYERSITGLVTCLLAGLPFADTASTALFGFFGNSLISNLGFSAILFGAHAWLSRTAFPRERVPAAAMAQ